MRALAIGWMTVGSLAAQLYTTDAGVQSPSLPSLRERFEWRTFRDAEQWTATTRFVYSPLRQVELAADLPLIARHVDGAVTGDQQGLGDLHLATKLALIRDDDVMRSDRLSVLGDVLLPIGSDDRVVDGVDLGPRAGLGLDAWGFGLGLGGTVVRDRHRAALAVRWWGFPAHDGFTPGQAVTVDAAWWYRLTPAEFASEQGELELRLTTDLLYQLAAADRFAGAGLDNGGQDLTFVVGLQAHPSPALAFELGLRVPLTSTLEGPFGDERLGGLFSARISF